ncbi:MAG: phosphoglycolate phosphatase [Gammaproteobacteria bacterium]|nr:phosphoglycolate phosphatase [Gammaproteobacteria bacterium]
MISTVLFDLDGTLVDTAPDMAHSLNLLLDEQGSARLAYEIIRPHVSNGSEALVKLGFGDALEQPRLDALKKRYLEIYQQNIHIHSQLFPGMEQLLEAIESAGKRWGVITNKPSWLTEPLLQSMGLSSRCACIVSGDTTAQRKPDPEPMYHACELIGVKATDCIYIGDARRDIEAGNNADMKTIIATYGYIGEWEDIHSWGADALIDQPQEINQYF